MAIVPLIVSFGNSQEDGIETVKNVPQADFTRWTGAALPTTAPTTQPYVAIAPGVRILQPRLPYAVAETRDITGAAAATITMDAAVAGTTIDQWVYVIKNSLGQGQHRQISANPATVTPTITPNWAITPAADGEVMVLGKSHTTSGASTLPVVDGVTFTAVNKTANTAVFTANDVGRWLIGLSGANAGVARQIVALISTTSVRCDRFPSAFAAGEGLRVLDGPNPVELISGIIATNCQFSPLGFYYDSARSYSAGTEYPSIKSTPYTGPNEHKIRQFVNTMPELTWQLRQKFNQPIHAVTLGVSTSVLAPAYTGDQFAQSAFSWGHGITHLDFHPSSPNGLYFVLTQLIKAACDLIVSEGNEPDLVGFFQKLAENDSFSLAASNAFYNNNTLLRDSLRKFVDDNGYSKRKGYQIPFITTDIRGLYFPPGGTIVSGALAKMAAADSRTKVVSVADFGYLDQVHYTALDQILWGQRAFEAWRQVFEADNYANGGTTDLPTLLNLRTRVKRRHERGTSGNNSSDAQINAFINDALREVTNTLGDSAWFLRRAEPATVEGGAFPNTISLDGHIARPLRIESLAFPGQALVWKGISHTSNLRTQITLHDVASAPYIVHFIQLPKELVSDIDVAVLPFHYTELVVVLTCKRLAECAANSQMAMYYASETERLWKYVRRDCLRYDRMRQESMTTTDVYDSLRNGSSSNWTWRL